MFSSSAACKTKPQVTSCGFEILFSQLAAAFRAFLGEFFLPPAKHIQKTRLTVERWANVKDAWGPTSLGV